MSRIGVNYSDVANAIVKLQAQGKTPSGDNIRAELGTGSKNTIIRLLREWKQQQGLPSDDDGSLPSELLSAVKALWERLQTKADDAIDGYREEYDAALREIQQQLNQYKAKDSEWQGKVHALEEKLHQQNADNKHLNATLIAEQQEKVKATGRVETLQARYQDSQSENERLHQLLKHVQANLEHYQKATQQLRVEQEIIVEKQRTDYEQRLLQLQQQVELVTRERTFLEARCGGLDKDYGLLAAKHTALESQIQELQEQHSELGFDCVKISQDYRRVLQDFNAQSKILETKNRELIECQLKLGIVEDNLDPLQKALSVAEDKIAALRDDYLFVSQAKANLEGQVKQLQATLMTAV